MTGDGWPPSDSFHALYEICSPDRSAMFSPIVILPLRCVPGSGW